MTYTLHFHGEDVDALGVFLAKRLTTEQYNRPEVTKLLLNESNNTLKTCDIRLVATLLEELRASDTSIPNLVAFLQRGSGVEARVAAVNKKEDDATTKKLAKNLIQRRHKLLRLDEEMRYGSMVRNVQTQSATNEVVNYQTNVRQHLSIGANMVMARVTAFIATYFVARNLTENETMRLVAGLVGAIVMMFIEMVLFITRAAKIETLEGRKNTFQYDI
ncbi:hypothetical protein PsorP6_008815 [Peronosclerospora sorghi]|uniref:Uncharacterized protein n=1 Tax=Peronosclerospora sorghi TaxID=230839 RepID=A0ACC0VX86_9STRA|nr:hypothetical protein PsorP6_008815 [Peronosclerospora sorghi]